MQRRSVRAPSATTLVPASPDADDGRTAVEGDAVLNAVGPAELLILLVLFAGLPTLVVVLALLAVRGRRDSRP